MVTAILVTNITYADYIVGNVVGSIYHLPVYSVRQDSFSINQTVQELLQNNVTNVIIIGGPAVISNLLLQDLNQSGISYTWIWGTTRYDTSSYVALYFWNNSDSAVLITRDLVNKNVKGDRLQLVTEAVQTAEMNKIPLIIVPDGVLTSTNIYALQKLNISHVYIFTGSSGELGNIPDQLNSLNITYTIYTPNVTPEINCQTTVYVNITENTSWEDIREIFVGEVHGLCFVPQVVNQQVNITEEKEEVENETKELFREYRNNEINTTDIILKHLNRMIETQELLIDKFEILCNYTNNSLPICSMLPQLNQSLYQTILALQSGNISELQGLFSLQNNLLNEDWKETRSIGESFIEKAEGENYEKIEKKIREHMNEETEKIEEIINETNSNIIIINENESMGNFGNNYTGGFHYP
jgi:predicted Holliday junction resolvase-like endonuclease